MKIKNFMISNVISVSGKTTLKELLEKLVDNGVGGVPVLSDTGELQGVISDGDVIRYLQPKGRTVYDMFSVVLVNEKESLSNKLVRTLDKEVKDIMKTKGIKTVQPDDNIEMALTIFSHHHFKKIPVVNQENKVVGVVSRGDIIRFITTQLIQKTNQ